MSQYRTIIEEAGRGAYDTPTLVRIEMRRDGRRGRITLGGFRWRGNSGGYEQHTQYVSRDTARRCLRAARMAQADALRGGMRDTDHPGWASILEAVAGTI